MDLSKKKLDCLYILGFAPESWLTMKKTVNFGLRVYFLAQNMLKAHKTHFQVPEHIDILFIILKIHNFDSPMALLLIREKVSLGISENANIIIE